MNNFAALAPFFERPISTVFHFYLANAILNCIISNILNFLFYSKLEEALSGFIKQQQ